MLFLDKTAAIDKTSFEATVRAPEWHVAESATCRLTG
jgi:hypothetical protein